MVLTMLVECRVFDKIKKTINNRKKARHGFHDTKTTIESRTIKFSFRDQKLKFLLLNNQLFGWISLPNRYLCASE